MFSALRATAASGVAAPRFALQRGIATSAAARDISRLTLIGRIAGVSEPRETANGSQFIVYTVATRDPIVNREQEPTSSFHRIYAFGDRTTERVKKLGKGDLVYAEADLRIERLLGSDDQPASERVLTAHRFVQVLRRRPRPEETEEVEEAQGV